MQMTTSPPVTTSISVADEDVQRILNRLRRAEGQLGAVIRMVAEGGECREVITQLAATRRALDRAGFAMIASGLRQCTTDDGNPDDLETAAANLAAMERLFLTLA